jgi:hypothetical protein
MEMAAITGSNEEAAQTSNYEPDGGLIQNSTARGHPGIEKKRALRPFCRFG